MVYGVNEAARFYFNKDVDKLTLAEGIFIASIIPRPKKFMYLFDDQGNLREHLAAYYSLVSSKMLRKEWINQTEFEALRPAVTLTGPAKQLLHIADSIPATEIEDEYFF